MQVWRIAGPYDGHVQHGAGERHPQAQRHVISHTFVPVAEPENPRKHEVAGPGQQVEGAEDPEEIPRVRARIET